MNMNRKTSSCIIVLVLAFTLLFSAASTAYPEAAPVLEEEDAYGLVQSDEITIPVFTEENMATFEIPDNEAMRFSRTLKAGWNLGNTFDANPDNDGYFTGTAMEKSWVSLRPKN